MGGWPEGAGTRRCELAAQGIEVGRERAEREGRDRCRRFQLVLAHHLAKVAGRGSNAPEKWFDIDALVELEAWAEGELSV